MPYFFNLFRRCKKLLLMLGFILFFPAALGAQPTQSNDGFLMQQEGDTLTIERYSRLGQTLEGRLLVREQIPIVYTAQTNTQHQLEKLSVKVLKPGTPEGTPARQEASLVFEGDSVHTSTQEGGSITKASFKTTPGAMAYHPQLPMLALLEQIVLRARTKGGKEVSLPVFLLSTQGQTIEATISFSAPDSARIALGNTTVLLKINKKGEIMGGKTSSGQTIQRLEAVPDRAFATEAPDYSAPADAPYTAEQVRIKTSAGHTLAGTLTLPKNNDKPVPVVVTITGSSPQDRDHNTPYGGDYRIFRQLADAMGRAGIAVLRMDDRGVGQSTGDFKSATSPERATDIREGIQWVQQHPAIDKDNIVLVGLSEGAMIAPMIAKTNSSLSGIVLMAGPASTGEEIMKYQIKNSIKNSQKDLSAQEKEKAIQQALKETRKEAQNNPWLRYFLSYNPLPTARQVTNVPVLILQGTTDQHVPPGDAKKLAEAFRTAGNQDVTLHMLEGINHIFLEDADGNPKNYQNLSSFNVSSEILQLIADWTQEKTREASK